MKDCKLEISVADKGLKTSIAIIFCIVIYLTVTNINCVINNGTEYSSYSVSDDNRKKIKREEERSLISNLLFFTINIFVHYYISTNSTVDPVTISVVLSFFASIIGFLLNSIFSSDKGYRILKTKGLVNSWKNALSSIMTPQFLRQLVSSFTELFLGSIVFKHVFFRIATLPYFRCVPYSTTSAASSLVTSAVLFIMYRNTLETRWTNPSTSLQSDSDLIKGSTVQFMTTLAAVLFLSSDTRVTEKFDGINSNNTKITIVSFVCLLMFLLFKYDILEEKQDVSLEPENLFMVYSPKKVILEPRQIVSYDDILRVDGKRLPKGEFTVIDSELFMNVPMYKVVSNRPNYVYKVKEAITNNKSTSGSIVFVLIGLIVGYMITPKSKTRTNWILFVSMLASPGFI